MIRRLMMAAGILFTMWINNAVAQHNALTVRIDTVTIQDGTSDIIVGVYYKITGTKPADFYGYDSRIAYDGTKLRAVSVLFQGTASELVTPQTSNTGIHDTVLALTLGQPGQGVDQTNPLLYMVRFSVLRPFDGPTPLSLYRFDITPNMNIDTVHREDGWVRFDHPVKPPVKVAVSISSAPIAGVDDTVISVPVQLSDVTDGNIKRARFSFESDTSVVRFEGSVGGTLGGTSIVTRDSVSGNRTTVFFSGGDTGKVLVGGGHVFTLQFRSAKRSDTVCTVLTDTALSILNGDANVDSISIAIGQICVSGTSAEHNSVFLKKVGPVFQVWPNPSSRMVSFRLGDEASNFLYRLSAYDCLGRKVFERVARGSGIWDAGSLSSGAYEFIAVPLEFEANSGVLRERIKLIH